MDAKDLLQRMRAPDAVDRLASVLVTTALRTPLRELIEADELAALTVKWTARLAASDALRQIALERVEQLRAVGASEARTPREVLPPELLPPLKTLAATPWTPSAALTLRLVDQPPTRDMMSAVLDDSLRAFAARMRTAERGLSGGLGALKRSGGLFGSLAQGLGDAATGIVGAVKDELEAAMEGRIQAFLGGATEQAVRRIASWAADPAQADRLAALRTGALDVLLDTPVRELAAEARELDAAAIADTIAAGAAAWAARPEAPAEASAALQRLVDDAGDLNLGDALADIGLADEVSAELRRQVARQLARLVHAEEFDTWLTDLLS